MRTGFVILLALFISCSPKKKDFLALAKADISILASDSLQGREVGSAGEKMAAAYIASRLESIGLKGAGTDGFYQDFFVKESQNPHEKPSMSGDDSLQGTSGRNLVAMIDNPGDELIVIGAHYDHLGFGGFSSLHRGDSAIHNGADDNASGVAALLNLAENLSRAKLNRDIIFIAFSGEEKGLWGSNYFVKNPTIDLSKVDFMVNMDMVGRLDTARGIAIHGTGTAPDWPDVINSSNNVGLKVIMKESGVGPSDHTSFYLQDIPVLHFFTGQHSEYHKPTDDMELINFEGILQISQHISNIVKQLDSKPKLAFQKTKDESTRGPKFTVTLGVVPDYLFDGKGMRIDGVSDDKPAQKAGLIKGDIVVKLGDLDIEDMMTYMKALSAFKAGDSTTVSIDRSGTAKIFDIVF
ncbi:MAG: hypothetical protein ACI83W_000027 [Marinoscillum sp.]|jgi:hypothetical protein